MEKNYINLYEIRLEKDLIYIEDLLKAFLFDCQCALFFIDITNNESFDFSKELISEINKNKYPYLKIIIVENKIDLENMRYISNFELSEFLNLNPDIDHIEISLKNNDNIDKLMNKIYDEVNSNSENKSILPINIVKKCLIKIIKPNSIEQVNLSLSLIFCGDSTTGKTYFSQRYINNNYSETLIANLREIKILKIYDKDFCKLTLWDPSGAERFRALPNKYYQNVDGVLILFDFNEEHSLNDVYDWIKQN